ncbi:MAG: class I SAM-dependent methyltransferase [Holosporaceae bacterium]|jgi:predicted O-methyltransferase YrrM|nr:class I SAM-dependent methyltransferase [Holosporaceae bacterium]
MFFKLLKRFYDTTYNLNYQYAKVIIVIGSLFVMPKDFCMADRRPNVEVIDTDILDKKEDLGQLDRTKLNIQMSEPEIRFLSYLIRRYKPKKIVEIGVAAGGSSVVILNAIKNIPNAKLYSIDLCEKMGNDHSQRIGFVVDRHFSHLNKSNWRLYTGNITAKFIDEIGKDIDFVFIDTEHRNPGEILDFLQILPYLKRGAIVVFHDVSCHLLYYPKNKTQWTNCALLNAIKGRKIIPRKDSWEGVELIFPNIGAIKIENNQEKFAFDYFNMLTLPWYYFPDEEQIKTLKDFFRKHYDDFCCNIFERAINEYRQLLSKKYQEENSILHRFIMFFRAIINRIVHFSF